MKECIASIEHAEKVEWQKFLTNYIRISNDNIGYMNNGNIRNVATRREQNENKNINIYIIKYYCFRPSVTKSIFGTKF